MAAANWRRKKGGRERQIVFEGRLSAAGVCCLFRLAVIPTPHSPGHLCQEAIVAKSGKRLFRNLELASVKYHFASAQRSQCAWRRPDVIYRSIYVPAAALSVASEFAVYYSGARDFAIRLQRIIIVIARDVMSSGGCCS